MTAQPNNKQLNALRKALEALQTERDALRTHSEALHTQRDALQTERDALTGENRVLRVERDLLKERLARVRHKMFAARSEARSEVRGSERKDMFFNEAEGLAAATQAAPAQEEESGRQTGADHSQGLVHRRCAGLGDYRQV